MLGHIRMICRFSHIMELKLKTMAIPIAAITHQNNSNNQDKSRSKNKRVEHEGFSERRKLIEKMDKMLRLLAIDFAKKNDVAPDGQAIPVVDKLTKLYQAGQKEDFRQLLYFAFQILFPIERTTVLLILQDIQSASINSDIIALQLSKLNTIQTKNIARLIEYKPIIDASETVVVDLLKQAEMVAFCLRQKTKPEIEWVLREQNQVSIDMVLKILFPPINFIEFTDRELAKLSREVSETDLLLVMYGGSCAFRERLLSIRTSGRRIGPDHDLDKLLFTSGSEDLKMKSISAKERFEGKAREMLLDSYWPCLLTVIPSRPQP
jgi:hypothetical protein